MEGVDDAWVVLLNKCFLELNTAKFNIFNN